MATQGGDTISLRPLSLRPGGGTNPFAGFAKGAGVGLKLNVSGLSSGAGSAPVCRGDPGRWQRVWQGMRASADSGAQMTATLFPHRPLADLPCSLCGGEA